MAARPLASANRPSRISANRSGSGTSLAAPPRLKKPLLSGSRLAPPTSTVGGSPSPLAIAASSPWSSVRAAASPAGSRAPDAGAARAAAPVGPALDGGGDHVTAVRVLVGVGREVVLCLAQLLVRVVAVELAVLDAVAQHLVGAGESGRGHDEHGEYAEDNQISYGSGQREDSPPGDVVRVCAAGRATGHEELPDASSTGLLPDCGANASNWPRLPRRGADNRLFSPVLACLNACDPLREAKLRRAATRSHPRAGPRSLPGTAVPQPVPAWTSGSACDLPLREPAGLGPARRVVPRIARLPK